MRWIVMRSTAAERRPQLQRLSVGLWSRREEARLRARQSLPTLAVDVERFHLLERRLMSSSTSNANAKLAFSTGAARALLGACERLARALRGRRGQRRPALGRAPYCSPPPRATARALANP